MESGTRRDRARRLLVLLGIVGAAVGIAHWPVATRQGVDFVVSSATIPLYVKGLEFVQRDLQYRRLARAVAPAEATEEQRVLAIFAWTRRNIRDVPAGFPVVDDHIAHIVIRGYGTDDQKADVFATLATYAGVPAFWQLFGDGPKLVLSFARVGDRWRVFDVANGLVFRNAAGALATPEEIAADPDRLLMAAATLRYRDRPYGSFFAGFRAPAPPEVLRAERQMIWPRLRSWARVWMRAAS